MIVDSSALVSILKDEPDCSEFVQALSRDVAKVSAATVLETAIVVGPDRHVDLDNLLNDIEISVVPFDAVHAEIARDAYSAYGRGSGSKARLNFGDCMSYALAKATGEPLLFKGDDFTHTDIESARS